MFSVSKLMLNIKPMIYVRDKGSVSGDFCCLLKSNYLPCNSAIDIVAGLGVFTEMKWLCDTW